MAAKKYQELSSDAKAKVIDDNRDINLKNSDWVEPVLDEETDKLVNLGFVIPKIEYCLDSKPYDGACFTCDRSTPPMLNAEIKSIPTMLAGLNDDALVNWIINQANEGKPIVSVMITRNGKYVNENASTPVLTFEYEPQGLDQYVSDTFPGWEIVSKSNSELHSLQAFGLLANEAEGKILYGSSLDAPTGTYTAFKYSLGSFTREKLIKRYEEWELYNDAEFRALAKQLAPVVINDENFDDTFRELGFADQAFLVAKFITFEKMLGEEAKRQYTLDQILEEANPEYLSDIVSRLNKFDLIVSENFTAYVVEYNKEIFTKIKAARDEATSDSAVLDTLEVNDFLGNSFDDEGNVYDPEVDKLYTYNELSPKAKAKVNDRYYGLYDFEEFNKDVLNTIMERTEIMGFEKPKLKLMMVKDPYMFIENIEVKDFIKARNWILIGLPVDPTTINSMSEIPSDMNDAAQANITAAKASLNAKLKEVTSRLYAEQTSEAAIADFYDGQKFDQFGEEVDE